MDLLTSQEGTERLHTTESAATVTRDELKKMDDKRKKLLSDVNQKQLLVQSIKKEIERIDGSEVGKSIEEYNELLTDLQNYRSKAA